MSGRGDCHDNAVVESFFNLLKRERIRRRVYKTRLEARQDVFHYIEMFYNLKRKHMTNGMLSPVGFERQQSVNQKGVYQSKGNSDCQIKSSLLHLSLPDQVWVFGSSRTRSASSESKLDQNFWDNL